MKEGDKVLVIRKNIKTKIVRKSGKMYQIRLADHRKTGYCCNYYTKKELQPL